jgi:hypothetical protein
MRIACRCALHRYISPPQIVAFVDKFAHVNQLDSAAMSALVGLECFARLGLTAMPSTTNDAGVQRQPCSPIDADAEEAGDDLDEEEVPTSPTPVRAAAMKGASAPIAHPVGAK